MGYSLANCYTEKSKTCTTTIQPAAKGMFYKSSQEGEYMGPNGVIIECLIQTVVEEHFCQYSFMTQINI